MFNEGFYAVRIDEWEQQRIPDTLAMARFQFGVPIAIVASAVGWQLATSCSTFASDRARLFIWEALVTKDGPCEGRESGLWGL
jgi:hypothetical protein